MELRSHFHPPRASSSSAKDVRDSRDMTSQRDSACFACGALVPDMIGPTHPYMLSAPGCWHLHGILSSAQYRRSQLSVDGYAVQHPGDPGRRANQSVCVHLQNLCRVLELGGSVDDRPSFLRTLTHRAYPWLSPPPPAYPITIVDLVGAREASTYVTTERRFAEASWAAWSMHHETIRQWLRDPGSLPPRNTGVPR